MGSFIQIHNKTSKVMQTNLKWISKWLGFGWFFWYWSSLVCQAMMPVELVAGVLEVLGCVPTSWRKQRVCQRPGWLFYKNRQSARIMRGLKHLIRWASHPFGRQLVDESFERQGNLCCLLSAPLWPQPSSVSRWWAQVAPREPLQEWDSWQPAWGKPPLDWTLTGLGGLLSRACPGGVPAWFLGSQSTWNWC